GEADPRARARAREEDSGERDPARGGEGSARKKMDLALTVVTRRGYAVRRVAEVLEVSRSQLHERLRHGAKPRTHYRKSEDAELLQPVRRLVDERPTYGYRRIGALLNRERVLAGLPRLNHKRLYRLMAQNGLLL